MLYHSNLSIKQKIVKKFATFYKEILARRRQFLSYSLSVLSAVVSQFICYNEYMKIDNNAIYYRYFSQKNLNHNGDLFENNGKMRSWEDFRAKLGLDDNEKFYRRQIIHAILLAAKEVFLDCGNNINDLIINEHHLIKNIRSIV